MEKNMQEIVRDIHNAIQNSRKTVAFLKENSSWFWVDTYPTAVVNEKNRITDTESRKKLETINFFDTDGFSKHSYTKEEILYLQENVPSALKTTYALCLKDKPADTYSFQEKFPHDRWKKVIDESYNFEAFIEASKFTVDDTNEIVETELRDIMRRAKEIPTLKRIGFVWLVTLPKTLKIEDILEHYFADNHIFVEAGRKITYIAWDDMLANINMRYFVNTP